MAEVRAPEWDALIVGAGVAGALVARELAQAGLKVCVLEAGDWLQRADLVQRFRASWRRDLQAPYPQWPHAQAPDRLAATPYYENLGPAVFWADFQRGVGGTTWHWTGIVPRFLPADFELRSRYGVGEDWPLGYAELEPWYLRAEQALGVAGDSNEDHGSPRSGPYPLPPIPQPHSDQVLTRRLAAAGVAVTVYPAARASRPYEGRPACCGAGHCTPICPTGASYSADVDVRKAQQAGAQVMVNAMVHRLEVGPDGRISAVRCLRPDRSEQRLRARAVVLACNGAETPRLLLMSAGPRAPQGVANASGAVGRYLMSHPILTFVYHFPEPLHLGRGPIEVSGINAYRDGPFRRTHAAAKFYLMNSLDVHSTAVALCEDKARWPALLPQLRQRMAHTGMAGFELEQLPQADNHLGLSSRHHDGHGLPLLRVHYRLDDYERRAAQVWSERMQALLQAAGGTLLRRGELGADMASNHIMGTTRMGRDPRHSVADADGRSHDHPNLYLAGSGLFPTGGTANPTLTLAALALRLAAHLRRELGAARQASLPG